MYKNKGVIEMRKIFRENPLPLSKLTDDLEEQKKLEDHFTFAEDQIVMIGLIDRYGDIRYEYPVIVTKVNDPDINGFHTYDYISFVRGNCEFISLQEETQRYLWRFCTKSNIPNWFLDIVRKWISAVSDEEDGYEMTDNICFIENGKLFRPFKDKIEPID